MLELNIHGYRIKIESYPTSPKSNELLRLLEFDFQQFRVIPPVEQSKADLRICVLDSLKAPTFKIPVLKRRGLVRFWSPGPKTWYQKDHQYRALLSSTPLRTLELTFENLECAHENVYLFLLSCIGEFFERRGRHRLHAVGYQSGSIAFVIPLNSGHGKTTFSNWLLENTSKSVLGDETLFTDGVQIWPYPIRRAVRQEGQLISKKQLESWPPDRVSLSPTPFRLILFRDRFSTLQFFWTFFWGIGNAQMLEYLLRWDTLAWLPQMALKRTLVYFRMRSLMIRLDSWATSPKRNFEQIENSQKRGKQT